MPGSIEVPLDVSTNSATQGNANALIKVYIGANGRGPFSTSPQRWILDLGSNDSILAIEATSNLNNNYHPAPIAYGPPMSEATLAGGSVRIATAHVTLAIGNTVASHQRSARSTQISVPLSTIDGIKGYGGDLGGDYLKQLGVIGLSRKDGKLLI